MTAMITSLLTIVFVLLSFCIILLISYRGHSSDAVCLAEMERCERDNQDGLEDSLKDFRIISDKYLKVTVHDNDFIHPLLKAVKILYEICYENSKYPDETDLENVKNYLNHLCFTVKQIDDHFEWGKTTRESLREYLVPDVYIVSGCDIPDWENAESVFMPLFDTEEEIILR